MYESILQYLREKRGFDTSGYRPSMIQRRVGQRISASGCASCADYVRFMQEDAGELDLLLDALTINVSQFFRDPLIF